MNQFLCKNHKEAIAALAAKHDIPGQDVDKIICAVFTGRKGLNALPFGTSARITNFGILTPNRIRYNQIKKNKDKFTRR